MCLDEKTMANYFLWTAIKTNVKVHYMRRKVAQLRWTVMIKLEVIIMTVNAKHSKD